MNLKCVLRKAGRSVQAKNGRDEEICCAGTERSESPAAYRSKGETKPPEKDVLGKNGRGKGKRKTNTGLCGQSLIEGISSVTIIGTKENPSFGWTWRSKWPPDIAESISCRDRGSLHLSVYKRTMCRMAGKKEGKIGQY